MPTQSRAQAISPEDVLSAEPGDIITMRVSVPYDNIKLTGYSRLFLPNALRSSASMAKEGP